MNSERHHATRKSAFPDLHFLMRGIFRDLWSRAVQASSFVLGRTERNRFAASLGLREASICSSRGKADERGSQNAPALVCQRAVCDSKALPEEVKDQRGLTHCPFHFPLRVHTHALSPLETGHAPLFSSSFDALVCEADFK